MAAKIVKSNLAKVKKDGSIRTKLSLILVISILVSALTTGILGYVGYRNNAIKLTGEKAIGIAMTIASQIDGDKFAGYVKTGILDDHYSQVNLTIKNAKERNDVPYIYAIADPKDGENYLQVIGGRMDEQGNPDMEYLNSPESKIYYSEEIQRTLETGEPLCTGVQEYEVYGSMIGGFAPILDSKGQVVGVVGADISANEQIKAVNTYIPIVLLIIALTSIVMSLLSARFINRFVSKPLRYIAEKSKSLVAGDTDIRIDGKYLKRSDEIGLLGRGFEDVAAHMKDQADIANRISEGDLSVDVVEQSEKDILSISLKKVVHELRKLDIEAEMLTAAAVEGNLETRGDVEKFKGGYQAIIGGFNSALDAIVAPLNIALPYIEAMSNGEELDDLDNQFKGTYGLLIQNLISMKSVINKLCSESVKLTEAFAGGELSYRADTGSLHGVYEDIINGINQALESLINPLNMAASYVERIGDGEIPAKITAEYQGDFNNIKNSINACIAGLDGLVEGKEALKQMSDNDYTVKVEGSYRGIFAEISESINTVSDGIMGTIEILNNISVGDLADLDSVRAAGKKSENDVLTPTVVTMMESIHSLVSETAVLSKAAVEGDLSVRGETGKLKGDYAKVIDGINQTMDAIIEPIEEAASVLEEMEKGNLNATVLGDYRGDHAKIKHALNKTIENLRSYIREISSVLTEISEGNLNIEITANYTGDFVEIKDSLNHISASLSEVMGNIGEAASQVTAGARQVSDGSQALSQGSTEQASSIEELSASIAEIASQTKQNAMNANQANLLAGDAKSFAEKGNDQMKEMLSAMDEISSSSSNISKVIKVIDDIAFQTNILALNAAVEAARAGAHGKGFAVVAEEVRSLAARSAQAVKETSELIEGSMDKVSRGTRITNDTAAALTEIVGKIGEAADLVEKIAGASNDQATGIAQIDRGIEQVAKVVQNNSATAEQSAAASEELSSQAEILRDMVSRFKTDRTGIETKRAMLQGQTDSLAMKDVVLLDQGQDKY